MALKSGREGVASSEVDRLGHISLPVASSSAVGGVKPVTKTEGMTQDVGVDSSGKLYTTPGSVYNLPVATSEVLGGVKPAAKTEVMTQDVGVDSNGALYTTPGGMKLYYKEFDVTNSSSGVTGLNRLKVENVGVSGYTPIAAVALDVYTGYGGIVNICKGFSGSGRYDVLGYTNSSSATFKAIVYYVKNENVEALT